MKIPDVEINKRKISTRHKGDTNNSKGRHFILSAGPAYLCDHFLRRFRKRVNRRQLFSAQWWVTFSTQVVWLPLQVDWSYVLDTVFIKTWSHCRTLQIFLPVKRLWSVSVAVFLPWTSCNEISQCLACKLLVKPVMCKHLLLSVYFLCYSFKFWN